MNSILKIFDKEYDIVSIGDTAVDVFIKIDQARESTNPINANPAS